MQVVKRNGQFESVSFDKITKRISSLCNGLIVDPISVSKETINGIYDGIKTQELDNLSADICASKTHHHPDYNTLASRISVSNLHKQTETDFLKVTQTLFDANIVPDNYFNFVSDNIELIQSIINYERDFLFDYFGFKTLERSYLIKVNGKIVERPQHLWMRVAVQIHGIHPLVELDKLKETYDMLSNLYFTHATPTLFNSGTKRPQLASCFLAGTEDTIEGIFKSVSDLASISKWAGGIGIHLTNVRCKGSRINGTNGKSDGIIPLCKVLESVGRYINQGSKRNGSIAVYLEPWHGDVFEFIELRKNTGDENLRTRDLFLAMWIPDLFMKRVKENQLWSLMCPNLCPDLNNTYGEEFERLYTSYEQQGKFIRQVPAIDLWQHILESQIETGMPYITYKDNVNNKSNQKNIGIIRSSNLCVAPETRILTETGYVPIKLLENTKVKVWNGDRWSEVTPVKTGENKKLVDVVFSNGLTLTCTPYHKFLVGKDIKSSRRVEAQDLIPKKDKLCSNWYSPLVFKGYKLENAYSSGYNNIKKHTNTRGEFLYEDKPELVPLNADFPSKISWISGLFDSRSFVNKTFLEIKSKNQDFLIAIKLLLQTLGLNNSTVIRGSLIIYPSEIEELFRLGLNTYEVDIRFSGSFTPSELYVTEIIDTGRVDDTYCFNESVNHAGVFEGILTGQCNEIVEYSDSKEYATCNLASLCLPKFVTNSAFDYDALQKVVELAVTNLNKVIDITYYPVPETKYSNMRHRPIGLGVQGLADVYSKLDIAFDSDEARIVNRKIFETIYYAAIKTSNQLAKTYGAYETFKGSPFSEGKLQFDLWGLSSENLLMNFDWDSLKEDVKKYGTRNSLLTALMPTASTAQIMKNNEAFEPYSSNIYVRKTLAGEYIVVNEYLVNKLLNLGLWNKEMYEEILYYNGSIQKIKRIPEHVRNMYKTAFEMKQVAIVRQAVERGPFIDQTQSMNLFQSVPDFDKLSASHFYSWANGLKTGMYYLRTQPAVDPIKFGLDPSRIQAIKNNENEEQEVIVCRRRPADLEGECIVCSS
jgi:ribonucleoside-diphosphate reductase alpha chain